MKNGRCRMHGGLSTGPRTPEGLERSRRARWKHGAYSEETKTILRESRLTVTDTGHSMVRNVLDRVFEPSSRLEAVTQASASRASSRPRSERTTTCREQITAARDFRSRLLADLQSQPPLIRSSTVLARSLIWQTEAWIPLRLRANAAVAAMTQNANIRRRPAPPQDHPMLRGIPLSETGGDGPVRLLSNRQRQELASIAARLHVPRRTIVYREHTAAESVFIVGHGVVKAFRDLPSGKRPVLAFHFAEDIFGLAENGFYVNTIQAVTDVDLFRMPLAVLRDTLAGDAELQLQFLVKVTHELREAQHHTIMIGRRDAVGRVASLLRSLEDHTAREDQSGMIDIPMTRSDIAGYLGLSLEAVSRACRRLERSGIVTFVDRHRARLRDRRGLDKLASAY